MSGFISNSVLVAGRAVQWLLLPPPSSDRARGSSRDRARVTAANRPLRSSKHPEAIVYGVGGDSYWQRTDYYSHVSTHGGLNKQGA